MIEIIYNEEGNDMAGTTQIKLPKNVRQVGNSDTYRRVYVEDYVMTYIGKLSESAGLECPAGILLGEVKESDGLMYIFVTGAILADNMEQEGMETRFTEKSWTDIYEKMRRYFDQQEIVGWFLARNDSCHEVEDALYKIHIDNFGGVDKVLLLVDMKEKEEEFYAYSDNSLISLNGYYIYYEKNEAMQSYMVDYCQKKTVDENLSDEAIGKYRSIIREKQEQVPQKRVVATLYSACTFLTVVILAIGVVILNNYDKMKQMDEKMSSLSNVLLSPIGEEKKEETQAVDSNLIQTEEVILEHIDGEVDTTSSQEESTSIEEQVTQESSAVQQPEQSSEEQDMTVAETTTVQETSSDPESTSSSLEALKTGGVYYTVLKGDTLSSISEGIYQTENMIPVIKEANALESEDRIYEGQVLYLP